jgi:hypothetical protein
MAERKECRIDGLHARQCIVRLRMSEDASEVERK